MKSFLMAPLSPRSGGNNHKSIPTSEKLTSTSYSSSSSSSALSDDSGSVEEVNSPRDANNYALLGGKDSTSATRQSQPPPPLPSLPPQQQQQQQQQQPRMNSRGGGGSRSRLLLGFSERMNYSFSLSHKLRKTIRSITQNEPSLHTVSLSSCCDGKSNNRVDTTTFCSLLGNALELNSTVQILNLQHNKIDNEGILALCRHGLITMKNNRPPFTSLCTLNLQHNQIGVEGASALGRLIVYSSTLQELNLSYNQLGNDGMIAFANEIQKGLVENNDSSCNLNHYNNTLSLDLGENKIGVEGIAVFAKVLGQNSPFSNRLVDLALYRNQLGSKGVILLCEEEQQEGGLSNCINLCKLNLSKNRIRHEAAAVMARNLPVSLQMLDLSHNFLGGEGVQSLIHNSDNTTVAAAAAAVTVGSSKGLQGLLKLDLSCNGIGNMGAIALASGLHRVIPNMEELLLWNNQVGNEGAIAFATTQNNLGDHSKLQKLQLSHNMIGDEGAYHLASTIEQHPYQFLELALEHNDDIGLDGYKAFLNVLRDRNGDCHLSVLRLGSGKITPSSSSSSSSTLPTKKTETFGTLKNEIQFYIDLNKLEKERKEDMARQSRWMNSRRMSRSQGSLLSLKETWQEDEQPQQQQEGLANSSSGRGLRVPYHHASVRMAVYV